MKWHPTNYKGVRYRKHKTRKHGVKFDQYFVIRYSRDGKLKSESLGWASEGWTAEKAFMERSKLQEAYKTGNGADTLKQAREIVETEKKAKANEKITFKEFWTDIYFPICKVDKVTKAWKREKSLFDNHIEPVIGKLPFKDIAPIHIEKIKKNMKALSNRSIEYALQVIRQVFNAALKHRVDGQPIFTGDNVAKHVKWPKIDNMRYRFLTKGEAKELLDNLKIENSNCHDMALMALHCGLRAAEVCNLRWADIDIENMLIRVKGKGDETGFVDITSHVKEMLLSRDVGKLNSKVFGVNNIPRAFMKAVNDMGLNTGVTETQYKVTFHTLRHTFASWQVQKGVSIYIVQKRMRHKVLKMTERYSHLAPGDLKQAADTIESIWNETDERDKTTKARRVS